MVDTSNPVILSRLSTHTTHASSTQHIIIYMRDPLGAVTVRTVHAALNGGDAAKVLSKALRDGAREDIITNAEERSVVASVIFGTTVLRSRLSWMLLFNMI